MKLKKKIETCFAYIVGKGEIVGNQNSLFLPQAFNPIKEKYTIRTTFNPLPDNNLLEWRKLKQIADNILKCT